MRRLLSCIIALLLLLPGLSEAQVYTQRMEEAVSQGDTALQRKILREWLFEWPADPDRMLAQSAFNKQQYTTETDSTARAAYLAESLAQIQTAKRDFPDRLDIRFAYIALLGEQGNYDMYTTEILDLLDTHDRIGTDWLWRNNNKLSDVDSFVRQYVDMYTLLMYNTKNDALLPLMDTISHRMLESRPDHVPALLSLSINAQREQDYPSAIAYLERAKTAEPGNTSVWDNLGLAYEKMGDTASAIASYEEIRKIGNEQEKAYATRKLQELGQP